MHINEYRFNHGKRPRTRTTHTRLYEHIIAYKDWYDEETVEKARADLERALG
ncbi:hypothetical protein [Shouchella shacheensis]|uniref:hypothetical protein n=1 Tax=Shouchella shacheensis TaxID=1649580 RepID=UPI000A82FDAA|nr:hypothetical protein [Shouchella shacheensis]